MSGYSRKPLIEKLGLKSGHRCFFLHPPQAYLQQIQDILPSLEVTDKASNNLDFIHFFTVDKTELSTKFSTLKNLLKYDGSLWISWPKKASNIKSDLDENVIRDIGLSEGLVDTKVCAIDDTWSGLKFVFRVKDRKVA